MFEYPRAVFCAGNRLYSTSPPLIDIFVFVFQLFAITSNATINNHVILSDNMSLTGCSRDETFVSLMPIYIYIYFFPWLL